MDRWDNWLAVRRLKMRLLIEGAIIVALLYVAVRFFGKRG
jgi:hypothetical protein